MSTYHLPTAGDVITVGAKGADARLLQELLTLAGYSTQGVDGDFGPNTRFALVSWQTKAGLTADGVARAETWAALLAPYEAACHLPDLPTPATLGEAVAVVAECLLALGIRELPGNRGPWVRLMCDGEDGPPWAWCAGFVRHAIRVACGWLGVPMPPVVSLECSVMGQRAQKAGRLLMDDATAAVRRGDITLRRKPGGGYEHTEIVERVEPVTGGPPRLHIIAGNTNDNGSREGVKVCRHVHGLAGYDIVRV